MAQTSGSNAIHKVSYGTWFLDTALANGSSVSIKHTKDPFNARQVNIVEQSSLRSVNANFSVVFTDEETTTVANISGATVNIKVVVIVP